MKPTIYNPLDANIRSILATVHAETLHKARSPGVPLPLPFVTISRQAGAGGRTLAQKVVELLHARDPAMPDTGRWAAWDHELVEKVSAEHHMAEEVVEALGEAQHPWFQDVLAGLSFGEGEQQPEEFKVYRRVAATIRALAKAGRAVIVGRGGVYLTKDLPLGVHVRLVAPRNKRIKAMAHKMNTSPAEAAAWVDHVDQARNSFYQRYWPGRPIDAEAFTVTLDTSHLTDEQMAAAVVQLVPTRAGAPSRRPYGLKTERVESGTEAVAGSR
jgi:cytidylate kinase